MVLQDKTKFGAPKYRLVVRISNKDITTQIVHAKTAGDDVLASAYSHELKDYGIPVGHTNYAAAYATGLLLARRALTRLGIADKFEGNKDVNGKYTPVRTKKDDQDDDESRFPFKAIMDVGLARTTTGARIFGAMKGCIDGGVAVPHRPNRFPGFNKEKDSLDAKVHRDHIFGKHVADYMKEIKEIKSQNPDDKITQFDNFAKNKITADNIEAMYKKAHTDIRANPAKKVKKAAKAGAKSKAFNTKKTSTVEKKAAAKKKIATLRERLGK
jgi:large subunit ribosomal protein L5e